MASIHKRDGSPNWYAAFYLPDGRRAFRSTGKTSRREALAVCLEYDKAAQLARADRLSETRAREVIADIYALSQRKTLSSDSIEDFLNGWLSKKALEVAESSHREYRKVIQNFLNHLGARAKRPLDSYSPAEASDYRDALSRRIGGTTVNKYIKIARIAWRQAVRDGHARENVFAKVDPVKASRTKRRPFTMAELRSVMGLADQEWRAMLTVGLYTGQRLGDISSLTWRQVDFAENVIRFTTRKTGRHVTIPMAKPLVACLMALPSSDLPDAPIFPKAAQHTTNTLSRQFGELLMEAGLVPKKDHTKQGQGRDVRRNTDQLSFHCLRHTATSLLKNAGVSDVVAREIIGHESEAVSRVYTHIETDTLRAAVERLPDIAKSGAKKRGKGADPR